MEVVDVGPGGGTSLRCGREKSEELQRIPAKVREGERASGPRYSGSD